MTDEIKVARAIYDMAVAEDWGYVSFIEDEAELHYVVLDGSFDLMGFARAAIWALNGGDDHEADVRDPVDAPDPHEAGDAGVPAEAPDGCCTDRDGPPDKGVGQAARLAPQKEE